MIILHSSIILFIQSKIIRNTKIIKENAGIWVVKVAGNVKSSRHIVN